MFDVYKKLGPDEIFVPATLRSSRRILPHDDETLPDSSTTTNSS